MLVDLYASLPHYAEHLWPIWQALPPEHRGQAWAPRAGCWWGRPARASELRGDRLCMVAGLADAQRMHSRPLVYVEHGAGQTYPGDPASTGHGSYSGGAGLDRVVLFLAPSAMVADRWRAAYPAASAAVVGCPKLDPWHRRPPLRSVGPTVAFTFHWDCPLVPETRWAWPHYRPAIPGLVAAVAAAGGRTLGHSHPRAWGHLGPLWGQLGVEPTRQFAAVLDRADVLVADNTSALYEFASLDRPVVVLNAPWYRRHVDHGLRYWELVPGLQVDQPGQLQAAVWEALADGPELQAMRRRAVQAVYAATDGRAASRAAAAIQGVLADA